MLEQTFYQNTADVCQSSRDNRLIFLGICSLHVFDSTLFQIECNLPHPKKNMLQLIVQLLLQPTARVCQWLYIVITFDKWCCPTNSTIFV